jgi:hypothetical protein
VKPTTASDKQNGFQKLKMINKINNHFGIKGSIAFGGSSSTWNSSSVF